MGRRRETEPNRDDAAADRFAREAERRRDRTGSGARVEKASGDRDACVGELHSLRSARMRTFTKRFTQTRVITHRHSLSITTMTPAS
eukprot:351965-Rhodomonas_salina.1